MYRFFQVLWRLLTSLGSLLLFALTDSPLRPLQLWTYSFHLMSATFTPVAPYSSRILVLLATSSANFCLIYSFCPSGQVFASGFLQIPLAMDVLAFGCMFPAIRAHWGFSPDRILSCWANKKQAEADSASAYLLSVDDKFLFY